MCIRDSTSPAPSRSFLTSSTNDLSAMSFPGPEPDVRMSPRGRPEGEFRRARPEGIPMIAGPTLEAGCTDAPRARPHAEEDFVKDELVYPREISLGASTLVFGLIGWLLLIVGTFGLALVYLLIGFVFYVFAHSAFISWLRGNAVLLSQAQLPDLRARFEACCARLGLEEMPEAYLMQGGGTLNAFATRFLGRNYVVLLLSLIHI